MNVYLKGNYSRADIKRVRKGKIIKTVKLLGLNVLVSLMKEEFGEDSWDGVEFLVVEDEINC